MAISKDKVSIRITLSKETLALLNSVKSCFKGATKSNIIETAVNHYARALVEYVSEQIKKEKETKENEDN